MLKDQANEVLLAKERLRRSNLISALYDDPAVCDLMPEGLRHASINCPLQWTPRIIPVECVSQETSAEQNNTLKCCLTAVDTFLKPSSRGVKFSYMVGRPGSGKSYVLKLAVAYCISKGLQVELKSFTSERARKLGGNHLHLVFPFHVQNNRIAFSHTYASSCLAQLDKDPLKKALLKRTDVLVFEEIGLLSAEYFSAIDNILRVLMGNSSPMIGKLFLSCGDSKQLPPIDGRPLWAFLNMCTMMDLFIFTCDVRARGDPVLQRSNSDCRRPLTAIECRSVAETVIQECCIVPDWKDVPEVAVRIVATKAAEMSAMENFLIGKETVVSRTRFCAKWWQLGKSN